MNHSNTFEEWEIFTQNIKLIRLLNRLSLTEMSNILGIGIYTLRKLEKGEFPPRMGIEVLFNIRDHFGVRPADMFKSHLSKISQKANDPNLSNIK